MSDTSRNQDQKPKRDRTVALALGGLVAVMIGLAFASAPLYRMFCEATGYGGVPRRADAAPTHVLDRTIRVRFDANVDRDLPWDFAPDQRAIDVKIGETTTAFFKASNKSNVAVTGRAVFNVVPEQAGRYFTKIECFCFKEHMLAAGANIEMPVTFFIDPKIVNDEDAKDISEITLSYTFYRVDAGSTASGNSGS